MSEEKDTPEYSVQAMLDAIHSQNLVTAKANFDAVIQGKIDNALEAEKVNMANQVYNGVEPEEPEKPESAELEADDASEEEVNDEDISDEEIEAEIDAIISNEEEESETENV